MLNTHFRSACGHRNRRDLPGQMGECRTDALAHIRAMWRAQYDRVPGVPPRPARNQGFFKRRVARFCTGNLWNAAPGERKEVAPTDVYRNGSNDALIDRGREMCGAWPPTTVVFDIGLDPAF